jgi:signal transduction histidine kinase/DNA-binding response OmpR family regulator
MACLKQGAPPFACYPWNWQELFCPLIRCTKRRTRGSAVFDTNRLVLITAVPIFLVLAFVAFLAMQFASNEREDQARVLHTYQVMDQIHRILADMQDAEAGQHGYLITHNPAYLTLYRAGSAHVARDISAFKTLTHDNPQQQSRADRLTALVHDRLTLLEETTSFAPVFGSASPDLLVAMENGKSAMDRVRTEIAAGAAEEQGILQARNRSRRQAEANEINTAFAAAIVALLILLAAALVLVRNNVRLIQTESERTRQRNILQATLDNIRDGVAVFNAKGELAAFNNTFFSFLDFAEELAVIGAPLANFQAIDRHRDQPVFDDLPTASGEPGDGYQLISLNGRELEIYRNTVPGGGFLVAAMDVTGRVRAEEAVRQAQKMEAIGHLTGGVAHDFNNLLQIVSANLDLATSDMRGNPKTMQRLQNAVSAVERGSRLTGQLLAFARRQALVPRTHNLGRLIPGMTDLLRRTLGERIEIKALVADGLWNANIDANQLENAIINLAINARDAMPNGGKLTIDVKNAYLGEDYVVSHPDVQSGQYVMVSVSDTGQGMPPDVVAHVFEPFFTTKPEGEGTGLGLSQVYGFVKQSGGQVTIDSKVGKGTTISLYLPRSRALEEDVDDAKHAPIAGGNETLLVVEDDEGVRAAVVDMLSELGYKVLKARDAESALEVLQSGQKIDLLFSDVVMPGSIPTRELARQARELQPGIAILFTSGYTQDAIVHNGKLDEDVLLLSKPYRKDDLARKLRSMLDKPARDITKAAAMTEASAPADNAAQSSAAKKALVVEDIALIRMTTVDMMSELGFETLEAATGDDAMKMLEQDQSIDVLLTDLGLPGMRGDQLSSAARELRPDLKIVIASGYSAETAGGAPPDVTFLQKPFDLPQLRRALGVG